MIQVIERALAILETVAEAPVTPQGLGEIAARVGLNPATCARILQTLVAGGYVEQVGRKKGYILGPMVHVLAARGPYRRDLLHAAEPFMRQLAQETRETVLLAVLSQGRRIVLSQVEGGQEVQVRSDLLQLYDPLRTATGRLLLAFQPAEELQAFLAYRRSDEGFEERALLQDLETIRQEQRAVRITSGEVVGIAYPIRQGDRVVAALGLYLPKHRFEGEHRRQVLSGMERVASAVGDRITAGRPPCGAATTRRRGT